jgi:hypothetical protein
VSGLRPDLLDEVSGSLYLIVTKIQTDRLKKLVIGSAADFSHASRFVVDLSALKDSSDEIIEAIAAFKTMYADTRVIVIADREPEGGPLFPRLFDMGVYDVVTDLGGDALKKCLTVGMSKEESMAYRVEKPDLTAHAKAQPAPVAMTIAAPEPQATAAPPTREKIIANRDFKKHKQFVTVAVCATEPHMGATHHALLTAKFLCGIGFKACYLEASERRNILYLARAYAVNANERRHLFQFEGVDMYFDFKLPEVIGAGYDFYIFDFGRFGEFETASFLTKDIKLVIGGAKAWEMPAYNPVFEAAEGCCSPHAAGRAGTPGDMQFIMNHAPPNEVKSIRELMGGYKTHFSEYAPYPFAPGVNLAMYKDIFRDYLTVEAARTAPLPERADKKGFWGKWR